MNRQEFEKPLKEKAIRLLQCRAGGRYTDFEAGMLYQICLDLGLADSRPGKIGAQEDYWTGLILSCRTEKEAKEVLSKLLKGEHALTKTERKRSFLEQRATEEREQILRLLKPYVQGGFNNTVLFEGLPCDIMVKLFTEYTVDLNQTHNESPTIHKLFQLAKEFSGTLEGNFGKNGLDIDAITVKVSDGFAEAMKFFLTPSTMQKTESGAYRFWWD